MKLPIRMTSPTGNSRSGFTFIEVMITLVILSAGIITIYRTFFLCVDYLSRLSMRMYANELIDEKIADISRVFHETADLSAATGSSVVNKEINHQQVKFAYNIDFLPVDGYDGLFQLKVGVVWAESGRTTKMARMAVLAL